MLRWVAWIVLGITYGLMHQLDAYGGLTFDAPWYLRQAIYLTQGEGWNSLSPNLSASAEQAFFFLWPPAYPCLLAAVGLWIPDPELWPWILNWLLVGTIIWRIKKPIYLVFFWPSLLEMAYQGWSEFPLLVLFWHIYLSMLRKKENAYTFTASFLLIMMAGLTRWLGGVAAFFWLIKFVKNKEKKYIWIMLLQMAFQLGWIYTWYWQHNYIQSQTGWNFTYWWQGIKDAAGPALSIFNPLLPPAWQWDWMPFVSPIILAILFLFFLTPFQIKIPKTEFLIVISISTLLVVIPVFLRGYYAVGINHHRFWTLAWAFILGVMCLKMENPLHRWLVWALVSWALFLPVRWLYYHDSWSLQAFEHRKATIQIQYQPVPSGALLVMPDKWAEWMRPDLKTWYPFEKVMGAHATQSAQMQSVLEKYRGDIWIDIPSSTGWKINRYHDNLQAWLKTQKPGVQRWK